RSMPIVYRSKLDWWLGALLGFAILMSFGYAIGMLVGGGGQMWWAALITLLVGGIFPLWILLSTRYTLDDEVLTVQSGPFRWRVPIAELTDIRPTSNPLSSPALSLDRLRIDYGRKSIMISPKNKEHFLAEIEKRRNILNTKGA